VTGPYSFDPGPVSTLDALRAVVRDALPWVERARPGATGSQVPLLAGLVERMKEASSPTATVVVPADEGTLARGLASLIASIRRNAPPALALTILADARGVPREPDGLAARTATARDSVRCPGCGREWPLDTASERLSLERRLGCGMTHDEATRAPDGIDFRSQHTEAGEPEP
jgi:hypothetical protein